MLSLKSHYPNNFDCYIMVNSQGQVPKLRFNELGIKLGLKPLEIFFDYNKYNQDIGWYNDLNEKIRNLNEQTFKIEKGILEVLKDYLKSNKNLLSNNLMQVLSTNDLVFRDSDFILELTKYYNARDLFSALAFLDCKFDEISIIEEDQLKIVIRKSHTMISEYFTSKEPLILQTKEFVSYFKYWFEFISKWKMNELPGLTYRKA